MPNFKFIKVGYKGVFVTWQCCLDVFSISDKAGMVGEDVVENVCASGASILSYCQQLHLPIVGETCGAAQTLCSGYSTVKNLFHQLGSLFG